MLTILDNALGGIISTYALIYAASKLEKNKINYREKSFYFVLISLTLISIFNYYHINIILKLFLDLLIMFIAFSYLFKQKFTNSIVLVILLQIIFMISDGLSAILISTIFGIDAYSIISTLPKILTNLLVSLLVIILCEIPVIKRLYYGICKKTSKIKTKSFLILLIIIIFLSNIIATTIYAEFDFRLLIVFNLIYTIFCFCVLIYLYKAKNNYIKVYDKYNTTLNSLKEYEDILDRYRVSNHENKNQLLTIRNMISKSDKKTISYIDKIVENKIKDNDKVMFEVSIIPAGGLRGLIYSKILAMKDLNIEYELEISNSIKTVDLISLDDALMLDICQIIGVYLDNAIEEVQKLKEKYINIEMYMENKELIIEISNNYKGNIDVDKLENKGYTSKGNGHGYGLSLTREIIESNKKLSNKKKISKEIFTQVLKIKM